MCVGVCRSACVYTSCHMLVICYYWYVSICHVVGFWQVISLAFDASLLFDAYILYSYCTDHSVIWHILHWR